MLPTSSHHFRCSKERKDQAGASCDSVTDSLLPSSRVTHQAEKRHDLDEMMDISFVASCKKRNPRSLAGAFIYFKTKPFLERPQDPC